MAHKFIAMLPGGEAPEYTEGREGYYWVKQLAGNSARTVLKWMCVISQKQATPIVWHF